MQPKKLTGWLIVLIVWIAVLGFNGGVRALGTADDFYRPYLADYPSLPTAIVVFKVLIGAGVAAWLYTAWVLYSREPGTLIRAQVGLVVGGLLRVASAFSIPILGGFPEDSVMRQIIAGALPMTVFILLFTAVWYAYLARSSKVQEIYAARP